MKIHRFFLYPVVENNISLNIMTWNYKSLVANIFKPQIQQNDYTSETPIIFLNVNVAGSSIPESCIRIEIVRRS